MQRLLLTAVIVGLLCVVPVGAGGATVRQDAPCTITGTSGPDTLRGTSGPDVICGGGGNDTLIGLGGADVLKGQGGSDRVSGGAGKDELLGGVGNDVLHGGAGNDELWGGAGGDYLDGDLGINPCFGGTADEFAQTDVLILDGCEDTVAPKITYVRMGSVDPATGEAVVTLRLVDDLSGLQTDPFELGNQSAAACWFQVDVQSINGGWPSGSCLIPGNYPLENGATMAVDECTNPASPTAPFSCYGVFPDRSPTQSETVRINRVVDGRVLDATFRVTISVPNFFARCGNVRFLNDREASPVVHDGSGNTRAYLYAGTSPSIVGDDTAVSIWPGAGPSGLRCAT